MRINFLLLFFYLYFPQINFGQDTTFINSYGGKENDNARSLIKTEKGGYLLVGSSNSFSVSSDIYVIETDSFGKFLWSKTYGGNGIEWGYSATKAGNGNYVIAGITNSFGSGGYDGLLIKIDGFGNVQWQKSFGGSDWDFLYCVKQTSDSGFILAGESYSFGSGNNDAWLIKTDKDGEIEWSKTFGGTGNERAQQVIQTFDGGFILCGSAVLPPDSLENFYVVKTNEIGDTTWTKVFGGDSADVAHCIIQGVDSNFFIAGATKSWGLGKFDFYLGKLNQIGDTIRTEIFGGYDDDEWFSIFENPANKNIVLVGYSYSQIGAGKEDIFYRVIDEDWYFVKQSNFGGSENERGYGIFPADQGGYVMAGTTNSYGMGFNDFILLKTYINGLSLFPPVATVFYDSLIVSKPESIVSEDGKVFPNPATVDICLHLSSNNFSSVFAIEVVNVLGVRVFSENQILTSDYCIKRGSLPDGIYYYFISSDRVLSGSFVLISDEK